MMRLQSEMKKNLGEGFTQPHPEPQFLKPELGGAGFTLIEMLVVIFGFSLIAYGLVALFSNIFVAASQQSGLLANADQARKVAANITTELRNAQTSASGAYGLDTAAAQQIIFYTNISGQPDIARVRYFVQTGQLWKGIIHPNTLGTYNANNESTTLVQSNLANGATPVFYYYDGSYNGIADNYLAPPVNVTQVRFIKVSLQIYNKAGVKNTNIYTVTAGSAIRNFKTNLGQ